MVSFLLAWMVQEFAREYIRGTLILFPDGAYTEIICAGIPAAIGSRDG